MDFPFSDFLSENFRDNETIIWWIVALFSDIYKHASLFLHYRSIAFSHVRQSRDEESSTTLN